MHYQLILWPIFPNLYPLKTSDNHQFFHVFRVCKMGILEAVAQRCSIKKRSQKFRKIYRKTPPPDLFFKKETLAQGFSCRLCEISKNTFSNRTPPVAASETLARNEVKFIRPAERKTFIINYSIGIKKVPYQTTISLQLTT